MGKKIVLILLKKSINTVEKSSHFWGCYIKQKIELTI